MRCFFCLKTFLCKQSVFHKSTWEVKIKLKDKLKLLIKIFKSYLVINNFTVSLTWYIDSVNRLFISFVDKTIRCIRLKVKCVNYANQSIYFVYK